MRGFSVPTLAGGVVAVASLAYFTAASRWLGDEALSLFVVAMAEVAVLQALLIPRTWLHVIAGTGSLGCRLSQSVVLELVGGVTGLLVLLAYVSLRDFESNAIALRLVVYVSLWVPSLTSATGFYRASHRWLSYFFWIAGSALLRFPALVWWNANQQAWTGSNATDSVLSMVVVTYLLPEMLRLVLGYLPLLPRHWQSTTIPALRNALKLISSNWRFDFLSALTESLDKVIVGLLFSPAVLVCYFFARRIAGVIPMVIEPYFAHVYQRQAETSNQFPGSHFWRQHYFRGLAISATLALLSCALILVLVDWTGARAAIPEAVTQQLGLFCAVLAIDAVMCANKWYRYMSQRTGASALFAMRTVSFCAFVLVATLPIGPPFGGTPVPAMLISLIIDVAALVYLFSLMRPAPALHCHNP